MCEIRQQIKPALPTEPMKTYSVPLLPWQIVASGCFECDNQHYLVVVDLYSDFPEIRKLDTLGTSTFESSWNTCLPSTKFQSLLSQIMVLTIRPQNFTSLHKAAIFSRPHVQSPLPEIKWKSWGSDYEIITKANKDGADLWKAILVLTLSQSSSQVQRLPWIACCAPFLLK